MKIFFDVDYTILGLDDTLRPGTIETLEKLKKDNHELYIWSGMGERWEVVEKHQLTPLVSGVYEKPTHHFHERLDELGVPHEERPNRLYLDSKMVQVFLKDPNGINVELGFFPHRDEMFRESMAEYQAAAREGAKKLKAKFRGKQKPARHKIPACTRGAAR